MLKAVCCFFVFSLGLIAQASTVSAGDVRYASQIRPLFEAKCAPCHGHGAPEYGDFEKDKDGYAARAKGPRMDSYAQLIFFIGWPDSGAVMRRLDDGTNTKDGMPGNMYQYLGASDGERQKNLTLFREWIGNWNLKKWPDVTKEEINGLKVRY